MLGEANEWTPLTEAPPPGRRRSALLVPMMLSVGSFVWVTAHDPANSRIPQPVAFADSLEVSGGGTVLSGVATFVVPGSYLSQSQVMGEGDASDKGGSTVQYPNPMEVFLSSIAGCVAEGIDGEGSAVGVTADLDLGGWVEGKKLGAPQIFRQVSVAALAPGRSSEALDSLRRSSEESCPALRLLSSAGIKVRSSWSSSTLPPPLPPIDGLERMRSTVKGNTAVVKDEDNGRNTVQLAKQVSVAGLVVSGAGGITITQALAAGVSYCLTECAQFVALNMSGGEERAAASSWAYFARAQILFSLQAAYNLEGGFPVPKGLPAAEIFQGYSLQVTVDTDASAGDVDWVGKQAIRRCPLVEVLRAGGVQPITIQFQKGRQ
eukprot:Hpha_TRINITY_DN15680_c3_g12::TRINITY_DN15680_c3_g12_i1::g.99945::m.99945